MRFKSDIKHISNTYRNHKTKASLELTNLTSIANSDTDFIVNEKGSYLIGNMNKENEFIASTSFRVDEAQKIQLSAEDYLDFEIKLEEK